MWNCEQQLWTKHLNTSELKTLLNGTNDNEIGVSAAWARFSIASMRSRLSLDCLRWYVCWRYAAQQLNRSIVDRHHGAGSCSCVRALVHSREKPQHTDGWVGNIFSMFINRRRVICIRFVQQVCVKYGAYAMFTFAFRLIRCTLQLRFSSSFYEPEYAFS